MFAIRLRPADAQVHAVPVVVLRRRRLFRGCVGRFLCPIRYVEPMRWRDALEDTGLAQVSWDFLIYPLSIRAYHFPRFQNLKKIRPRQGERTDETSLACASD